MSFELIPGNALGCRTNAHRHGWNGKICERAAEWSCGIDQEFREKYCENGIPRCFHLHIFDDSDPFLVIPDSGVGWILDADPHAFDDQILLVWAPDAEEPNGVIGGKPGSSFMAGAYRIESAERQEHRNHVEWHIRPYPEGWVFLGTLAVQAPRFIHLDGPYIKQVERSSVDRLFEAAREAGASTNEDWTAEDRVRLQRFAEQMDGWFASAKARTPIPHDDRARAVLTPVRRVAGRDLHASQERGRDFRDSNGQMEAERVRPAPVPSTPAPPMEQPQVLGPIVEEAKRAAIAALYGEELLTALRVGAMTKPIVIVRGEPGVGKSRLAAELLDDVARERTLVVPVPSTWCSREDLLGRVQLANGLLEPTELATFLHRAELAWDAGDRRTRLVVFDDFDRSPPEAWLAEILSRSHCPPECRRDRTIDLGASGVRGWERGTGASIYLSPAVRFVGTVDLDRASRPLSLRVLDRAALITLTMDPRTALERIGVKLTPKQVESVGELSRCTKERGASFSFRAALSLKTCLARLDELGIDAWGALDLVLRQDVLAKLDLDEREPGDRLILEKLDAWSDKFGNKLRECARVIAGFQQRLEAGESVLQS